MSAARSVVLLAAVAGALWSTPALADGTDDLRWTVQPDGGTRPQFTFDQAPGSTVQDTVTVTNLSGRPLTFAVYATDAATTSDGAFSLLPASGRPTDAGAWISLSGSSRTVEPGRQATIPFTLAVPPNATPGDHAAGIIASVAAPEQGGTVLVDRRVAARVYLRVPGTLNPVIRLEDVHTTYDNPPAPFARGPMTVTYRVRNTGNVRVTGTTTVRASGPLGLSLSDAATDSLPELLPRRRGHPYPYRPGCPARRDDHRHRRDHRHRPRRAPPRRDPLGHRLGRPRHRRGHRPARRRPDPGVPAPTLTGRGGGDTRTGDRRRGR